MRKAGLVVTLGLSEEKKLKCVSLYSINARQTKYRSILNYGYRNSVLRIQGQKSWGVYCLLTIGALWLIGTQNITYKIQVNGEGFAYYSEHIL